MLKGTKVDGVYDKDPATNDDAVRYSELVHKDLLHKDLRVLDATAASLCMENNIPLVVFNLHTPGNIIRIVRGEDIGTKIRTAK